MNRSNDLFDLIKSMTGSEKRYFKLTSSPQKGEKNYLRLFDAIDRQNEYDENALRRKFAGERFIVQLHVMKHYLYDLLLKSLRSYHDELSADARIGAFLHASDILYRKGLKEQAEKQLDKGEALAKEYEKYERQFEIKMIRYSRGKAITREDIEAAHTVEMELVEKIALVSRYKRLLALILSSVVNSGFPRDPEARKWIDSIMDDPLMRRDPEEIPMIARLYYYNIATSYFYSKLDFESALRYAREQVALNEQHPGIRQERLVEYVAQLNNMLICLSQLGLDTEFKEVLDKLKSITTDPHSTSLPNLRAQSKAFNCAAGLEFSHHLERGEFRKALNLVDEIESGLSTFGPHIPESELLRFHYLFAQINLIMGDHTAALHHINVALTYEWIPTRRQIYNTVRIVNLLIHYELGNLELLRYQIHSTYRFFRKQSSPHKVEQALLRYLRRTPALIRSRDVTRLFQELHAELVELEKDPFEEPIFAYFDYIGWLESKVEKRSLVATLQRRKRGKMRR